MLRPLPCRNYLPNSADTYALPKRGHGQLSPSRPVMANGDHLGADGRSQQSDIRKRADRLRLPIPVNDNLQFPPF